jgi:hypothetical protein
MNNDSAIVRRWNRTCSTGATQSLARVVCARPAFRHLEHRRTCGFAATAPSSKAAPAPAQTSSRNGPSSSLRRSKKARCRSLQAARRRASIARWSTPSARKFNIKVEVSTGNATDTVNRLLAERKGGRFHRRRGADQFAREPAALVPSDSLVPITPLLIYPDVIDMSKWYKGRTCTPTSSASSR